MKNKRSYLLAKSSGILFRHINSWHILVSAMSGTVLTEEAEIYAENFHQDHDVKKMVSGTNAFLLAQGQRNNKVLRTKCGTE